LRLRDVFLAVVPLAMSAFPAVADNSTPFGEWATKGVGSIIDVHACADDSALLCGTIVWLWDDVDKNGAPYLDDKNADPNLRSRPMVGLEIMRGFKPKGDGKSWIDGTIYNPEDGRNYSASFRLRGPGTAELEGCALGLFCGSQIWRRPREVLDRALKR